MAAAAAVATAPKRKRKKAAAAGTASSSSSSSSSSSRRKSVRRNLSEVATLALLEQAATNARAYSDATPDWMHGQGDTRKQIETMFWLTLHTQPNAHAGKAFCECTTCDNTAYSYLQSPRHDFLTFMDDLLSPAHVSLPPIPASQEAKTPLSSECLFRLLLHQTHSIWIRIAMMSYLEVRNKTLDKDELNEYRWWKAFGCLLLSHPLFSKRNASLYPTPISWQPSASPDIKTSVATQQRSSGGGAIQGDMDAMHQHALRTWFTQHPTPIGTSPMAHALVQCLNYSSPPYSLRQMAFITSLALSVLRRGSPRRINLCRSLQIAYIEEKGKKPPPWWTNPKVYPENLLPSVVFPIWSPAHKFAEGKRGVTDAYIDHTKVVGFEDGARWWYAHSPLPLFRHWVEKLEEVSSAAPNQVFAFTLPNIQSPFFSYLLDHLSDERWAWFVRAQRLHEVPGDIGSFITATDGATYRFNLQRRARLHSIAANTQHWRTIRISSLEVMICPYALNHENGKSYCTQLPPMTDFASPRATIDNNIPSDVIASHWMPFLAVYHNVLHCFDSAIPDLSKRLKAWSRAWHDYRVAVVDCLLRGFKQIGFSDGLLPSILVKEIIMDYLVASRFHQVCYVS